MLAHRMQLVLLRQKGLARPQSVFVPLLDVDWMAYPVKETGIGEVLVRSGIIDATGLARAREAQEKNGTPLSQSLATMGLANENAIVAAIARSMRLEELGSELPEVAPEVATLLPSDFCRKRGVIPLSLLGKILRLGISDPMDYSTIQDAEFRSGKRVLAVVAGPSQIQSLIQQVYPAKIAKDTKMPPVVRLVNLILSGAAKSGASDIHMEPKESHLQVRYRVDGLLREVMKVPRNQLEATISRMKIISGMDIADRRRPQDGRSRLKYEGKRIDLRVSTLPTQFGEKVVIRLLDSKRAQVTMEQLGLTAENQHGFQLMLSRAQGMILVTGPTGSGKSSTLYTALNWVK